ncbi:hypothetical protein DQ244_11435 [Blastococcus sp. TBT05-19]|uniref:hypothetical protein n=1 Tax=Blastococcus sp. TBT05-19 TaxID=2250581 RepID=UPI000DEB7A4F|nr:hypothetical protein [Blastococcus sp. TBT05-19]RBY90085.1 hypothetical protein DQ244_11435 [Blastococcus sp. TBT05-19]
MTASPRTLRAWRRIGLALGIPAAVLVSAAVVVRLVAGREAAGYVSLALPGLLAGLLAVVFLRRVWSEPGSPGTGPARAGQRLSDAFLLLWGLGVLLNVAANWVDVPGGLRAAVALAAAVALVATVGAALRERPEYARE